MERKSYVYKITCLVTGEFYFGSSFNAKSDSYWGSGRKIRERISKYGKENFVKEILGEFYDRVEAHQVENQYIKQFRHDVKCLNQMLNRHFGSFSEETCTKKSAAQLGEKNHNFGKHFSEEHREKLSAANIGKHRTEETRSRMSAAKCGEKNPWYGKHRTEESRAKMSSAHIGKHLSEETKQKIRESMKRHNSLE